MSPEEGINALLYTKRLFTQNSRKLMGIKAIFSFHSSCGFIAFELHSRLLPYCDSHEPDVAVLYHTVPSKYALEELLRAIPRQSIRTGQLREQAFDVAWYIHTHHV